jgi:hypothetical protein
MKKGVQRIVLLKVLVRLGWKKEAKTQMNTANIFAKVAIFF